MEKGDPHHNDQVTRGGGRGLAAATQILSGPWSLGTVLHLRVRINFVIVTAPVGVAMFPTMALEVLPGTVLATARTPNPEGRK